MQKPLELDPFRNQKALVQALRIGIFLLILGFALLLHLSQSNFFNWSLYWQFYVFSALGILTNACGLLFVNALYRLPHALWFSFFIDIFLISSIHLKSELSVSIFLFSYMLEIVLMSLLFQTRGALLLAAFCSLCFSFISLLGPEVKAMSFVFSLVLYNIAFFAMAWVSGLLGEQLEAQGISLSQLRALNQSIVETIPSGLITVNSAGEILTANPGALTLFRDPDLTSKNLREIAPELFSQLAPGLPKKTEVALVRDGDNLLLSAQIIPHQSEAGHFLIVLEDVTEIRRLELTLMHQEKLAAIGGLASGIAHELGNPLAAVSANIQFLEPKIRIDDDTDRKLIQNTHREISRLGRLIGEFKDFAKPEKLPVDYVQLDKLLPQVLEVVKRDPALPKGLDPQLDIQVLPPIRGSSDKLTQVFLNVLINAVHALKENPEPRLQVSARVIDTNVIVKIRDNGVGMSAETKARLFEPFFTTKGRHGTGLGLAIAYKILQAHEAQVSVDSTKGQGTEFLFRFPLAIAKVSS